jgi:Spy/CpxP family protein refolding chaperone
MKWGKAAAIAALIVVVAAPAEAQRRNARPMRPADGHGFGARGAPTQVESALRLREELKLTPAQVTQLQNLRREIVAQRQKEAVEMIELRSRIAAGEVAPEEMRKQFAGRREMLEATMKQRREQFDRILSEDQRGQLNRARMNMHRAERPRDGRRGIRPPAGPRWR